MHNCHINQIYGDVYNSHKHGMYIFYILKKYIISIHDRTLLVGGVYRKFVMFIMCNYTMAVATKWCKSSDLF